MKQSLDTLAHFLYEPTMAGKDVAVARWHHRIHLIPGWLVTWVCDRYDASLWAEFDATEDEIDAMMTVAEPVDLGRVCGWQCEHFTMTSGPGILTGPPTMSSCQCKMRPIYDERTS